MLLLNAKKYIAVTTEPTCSPSPATPAESLTTSQHLMNMTLVMFHTQHDYINMLLQMCSQRNVAQEMWRLFLLLYGLASVLIVSKSVRMQLELVKLYFVVCA